MMARHRTPHVEHRHAVQSPLGRITLAGRGESSSGLFDKPMRRLGGYAAVYIYGGQGRYEDAHGFKTAIEPGDMMLVFPTHGHWYGPLPGQSWHEIWYVFDGPVFELWERSGLLSVREPVHHLEPIDYWLKRFEQVLGAPQTPGHAPPLVEVCRLQQLLADALAGGPRGAASQAELKWLQRAKAMLESGCDCTPDLHAVAVQLDESYDSFRKRFAHLAGTSPKRWHSRRLIDRACELMQHGDLTDKQIAMRLGFYDEFHFSRRFKQITGCPPRVYRRRLPA